MATQRIRFRLHVGGQFIQVSRSKGGSWNLHARLNSLYLAQTVNPDGSMQWKYCGGEIFNESMDADCSYSDLCLKINEKLSRTTSIKYLAPGEDLSPDELISVEAEDDLKELKEEFFNALSHPDAQSKTFRVKLFLFPALQDELDMDVEPELVGLDQPAFDPEEWCGDDEDEDVSSWNQELQLATPGGTVSPTATNEHSGKSREGMQWDQPRLPSLKSLVANEAELNDYAVCEQKRTESLPLDFVAAFVDRPSNEKKHMNLFGGISDPSQCPVIRGGLLGRPFSPNPQMAEMDLLDPYHDDKLDRHAMDNLLQSVLSKSAFSPQQPMAADRRRRPFALNPRITEEMDLLDPYHEDDSMSIRTGGGFLEGLRFNEGERLKQSRLKQVAPPPIQLTSPQPNAYSSLAGYFPSHISIFGGPTSNDTNNNGGAQNGAGGMNHHEGARALSGGADGSSNEEGTLGGGGPKSSPQHHTSPRSNASHGNQRWQIVAKPPIEEGLVEDMVRSVHLPSHISIFGEVDDSHMEEVAGPEGLYPPGSHLIITQEFKVARTEARQDAPHAIRGDVEGGTKEGGEGEEAAFQLSTPKVLEEVMQVCIDEVQIIRKIGEGAFGEVSFANIQSHGDVAIKWLKVSALDPLLLTSSSPQPIDITLACFP